MLIGIIFSITFIIVYIIVIKTHFNQSVYGCEMSFFSRLKIGALLLLFPILSFIFLDKQNFALIEKNKYNQELAKNGFYSLFSAFRHNELDYYEFYKTLPDNEALSSLRSKLKRENVQIKSDNISQIIKSD
jgi:hypothetical protein